MGVITHGVCPFLAEVKAIITVGKESGLVSMAAKAF